MRSPPVPLVVEICGGVWSAHAKDSISRGPGFPSACYIEDMPKLPPALKAYVCLTCGYGLVHAVCEAWSLQTRIYQLHPGDPPREVLLVDKASLIAFATMVTPATWPLLLRDDLIRLECYVRGKRVADYLRDEL